ncbi:MAG: 3-deoxy-7-phosphoheptulonate synthase [Castellaniella sp.]|uniref:3-deoxy-7-phosphoheptulonate synthase AroG n=1 Tax=Castellaniella sp. TaxID=1955812 RepID=UPI001220F37B|nr:3-deoxy-7-phosphoheptulonate synthase AroG [Castellaniella sp.]TAN26077.1 MAG: 3-deoxy-7-phosphoheptulonate synthase [Castellaniella sp.]
MSHNTDDIRIREIRELAPPAHVMHEFPCTSAVSATVHDSRQAVHDILHGHGDRLVVVIGPCSIHDPQAAMEYARRLAEQRERYAGDLEIIMRVYFEKPRTTVGWKGLINDPGLDGSFDINQGLRTARRLLLDINSLGLPAGCEFLDMITPQYIADLVSWGAIGARTTESQVHRELASGLSCPVGFKNGTDGNIRIAIDALKAAAHSHYFLSVTKGGRSAIVSTRGNEDCHIILRGGKAPNYEAEHVQAAAQALEKVHMRPRVMIDASHANSKKDYTRQPLVIEDICGQVEAGDSHLFGVMIESHLVGGRQDLVPGKPLVYGQSITDGCVDWDTSLNLLDRLARAVRGRREHLANAVPAASAA